MATTIVNTYEVPNWAGKPPVGLHLDVLKDGKMIQKLMIDEKKCYFFGRNKQLCDFCIDHASSSRVHAALVWHKFLERPFLIDLGSTHGTFIGNLRLEAKKPQQVPLDSIIRFGASTRAYVIRERPQAKNLNASEYDELDSNALPENEVELDNLTEFNTAHNRRIANVGDIPDNPNLKRRKRKLSSHVHFNDEEEVINPEDVDPSIGRFRNMIQTTIIPKKARIDLTGLENSNQSTLSLSSGRRLSGEHDGSANSERFSSVAERVGLRVNVAPEVSDIVPTISFSTNLFGPSASEDPLSSEPRKKKYAKEAWPGKKPTHGHSLLG